MMSNFIIIISIHPIDSFDEQLFVNVQYLPPIVQLLLT
jgi:hypothetical protein